MCVGLALVFLSAFLVGCERSSSNQSPESSSAGNTAEKAAKSKADKSPSDQHRAGATERGTYFVEVSPEPNPIPFQQLFELRVEVFESKRGETPAEEVQLDQVRARMPAHDHGMKTAPKIVQKSPGEFLVRGMRFHMRGEGEDGHWVIELVVNGADGIDNASFDYQCCTD